MERLTVLLHVVLRIL